MTVNEAYLIYFSPTHTSKQIAEAIVHGAGIKNILPINVTQQALNLIHISKPTRLMSISYAVFFLKKKNNLTRMLLRRSTEHQEHIRENVLH